MIKLLARPNGHAQDCRCFTCEGHDILAGIEARRRRAAKAVTARSDLVLEESLRGHEMYPYGVRAVRS